MPRPAGHKDHTLQVPASNIHLLLYYVIVNIRDRGTRLTDGLLAGKSHNLDQASPAHGGKNLGSLHACDVAHLCLKFRSNLNSLVH